jgi:hypothetical protein
MIWVIKLRKGGTTGRLKPGSAKSEKTALPDSTSLGF